MDSKDDISASLLDNDGQAAGSKVEDKPVSAGDKTRKNFDAMALYFSVTHGCVTSCLSYASTELGDELGGIGSGCLYICYASVALLLSSEIVKITGPKKGLLLGLWGYCIYVVSFLVALISPQSVAWPFFIVACIIGGSSGGVLWTAQGQYFARSATIYAEQCDMDPKDATTKLAGIFATYYLGVEVITKCIATLLFVTVPGHADTIVFIVYSALAVISAAATFRISSLDTEGSFNICKLFSKMDANALLIPQVRQLLHKDARILYLVPFQVSFGLATSVIIFYVFGHIIAGSDVLGTEYVGFLSSIVVVVGTAMAIPGSSLATVIGKEPLMIAGSLCFSFVGFILLMANDDTLGSWGGVVGVLCLHGVGRCVWENQNKATIADLYDKENMPAAFAIISFSNGVATAIGFFTFSELAREEMAIICGVAGVVALCSYVFLAYFVNMNGNKAEFTPIASEA